MTHAALIDSFLLNFAPLPPLTWPLSPFPPLSQYRHKEEGTITYPSATSVLIAEQLTAKKVNNVNPCPFYFFPKRGLCFNTYINRFKITELYCFRFFRFFYFVAGTCSTRQDELGTRSLQFIPQDSTIWNTFKNTDFPSEFYRIWPTYNLKQMWKNKGVWIGKAGKALKSRLAQMDELQPIKNTFNKTNTTDKTL